MKKAAYLSLIMTLLAVSCGSEQVVRLLVINPLDQQRDDAIVLITKTDVANWTDIPAGKVPVLSDENGMHISCQFDDLDSDGDWDELIALTDLEPKEQITLLMTFIPKEDFPSFERRTNLRLGANKPGYPELLLAKRLEGVAYHNYSGRTGAVFQMEGPAWENDRVGFRNYLDQRNGMDIFGKLSGKMVLDSVGVAGKQSYHELADWGMDVLKVGTSLGAGAIGYLYHDSIYRVGDNGSGTYELLFEGSLRSRFSLTYSGWKVGSSAYDITHQIEIVAGRHCYQSFVSYSGLENSLDLVPGIVNINSDTLYVLDLNDHFTGLMTYDHQAEDTTLLAMALIVPSANLLTSGESEETGDGITQTYYAVLDAKPDEPVPYRFYSLWESEDPRWASREEITKFLRNEADRWTNGVYIQPLP